MRRTEFGLENIDELSLGISNWAFHCLVLLVTALCLSSSTWAQVSPGPLSKAHQTLAGNTQCASCHEFGTSTPTFKCLDCHKEIAQRLSAKHGFHAQIKMRNPNGEECVRCHLEHNGEKYDLIQWMPSLKQFDHQLTGYNLEGKHASVACEKCHTASRIIPVERAFIKIKDLSNSFLGLSQKCLACHADPHKGQLGSACEQCHNTSDWKQATQFDHSKTRYPLTGMHARIACEKCHKAEALGQPVKFRGLRFDTCTACHSDPHKGAFKERCETCHTTSTWKKVGMSFDFDHSKTKFPLLGLHEKVNCTQCHFGGDFRKPLAFENCADCHKPDPHKNQFVARRSQGECKECHNVFGWKPSLFGLKEHADSNYPLFGKHSTVECSQCHIPAGADTIYKVKFGQCLDCHKDAHDGQFAKDFKDRCETCHTVNSFHRSKFTIAMHRDTRFALEGAHGVVPCIGCHKTGANGRADKILPFHFEDRSCTACHSDPHHGEFNERMKQRGPSGTQLGCEACHSVKSWTDVKEFDHSKTEFPLIGAHRAAACGSCHKAPAGSGDAKFKGTPKACEGCHVDVHGSQFAKNNQTQCADCHNSGRWTPSIFDHDRRTSFPLTGGHAHVSCEKCHTETQLIDGNTVIFYHLAPSQCADCHGKSAKPLERRR